MANFGAFAMSHPRGLNMVEISISGDHLHLEVKGLDKLWAFKSQLEIPLAHIAWCTRRPLSGLGLVARRQAAGHEHSRRALQAPFTRTASVYFGMFTIQTSPSSLSFMMIASMN